VVAVSDEAQIEKIKAESKGVIDEKSLRTWDSDDVWLFMTRLPVLTSQLISCSCSRELLVMWELIKAILELFYSIC
jgi:hypothetical protein